MTTLVQAVWQCCLGLVDIGTSSAVNLLNQPSFGLSFLHPCDNCCAWAEPVKVDTEVSHRCSVLGNGSLSLPPAQAVRLIPIRCWNSLFRVPARVGFPPAGGKKMDVTMLGDCSQFLGLWPPASWWGGGQISVASTCLWQIHYPLPWSSRSHIYGRGRSCTSRYLIGFACSEVSDVLERQAYSPILFTHKGLTPSHCR